MKKVKFHNKYKTDITIFTTIPVSVYIDEFPFDPIPKGSIRMVMLEEPLRGPLFELAKNYPQYYDYLLTYQDDLLQTNPKAVFFRCADTWVQGYEPEKKFCVSTVVGGKNDPRMQGYAMRHELWHRQKEIIVPKDFYLSGNFKWKQVNYGGKKVLGENKKPLFDSMFHISIENTSIKHYFSEKLLDCFHTRTIPIYYGCINIGEYFNIYGMILVNSVDDIIRECNKLTPELYEGMFPAVEDNYQRAQTRVNYFVQLEDQLRALLDKIGVLCQQA